MKILAVALVSVTDRVAEAGPRDLLDRIEDRIDRRESVQDCRGQDVAAWIDRHECRSWWLCGDRQPS